MADTTDPAGATDVQDLSYEQARDELVRIVARIESGDAPLEESMTLWERGEALASHCQAKLDQAQTRLDTATGAAGPLAGADAAVPTTPSDAGEDAVEDDDDEPEARR